MEGITETEQAFFQLSGSDCWLWRKKVDANGWNKERLLSSGLWLEKFEKIGVAYIGVLFNSYEHVSHSFFFYLLPLSSWIASLEHKVFEDWEPNWLPGKKAKGHKPQMKSQIAFSILTQCK